MIKADMHMHSTHSDGESDIFKMGKEAYERGFQLIGFSDHAYSVHEDGTHEFGIRGEELDSFINDVYTLRDMYRGKMEVLCGLEMENLSGFDYIDEFQQDQLDYRIGSTHMLSKNGISFDVDNTEELFVESVEMYYGGDYYAYVKDYYETVSRVTERTQCNFIGHLDLVTKFNHGGRHFDEACAAYQKPALECIDKLMEADIPFEINTGAMSRGYRKEPYPSRWLLKELHKRNARITLNSDAHDSLFMGFGFEPAMKLAWDCGFRKLSYFTLEGEMEFQLG